MGTLTAYPQPDFANTTNIGGIGGGGVSAVFIGSNGVTTNVGTQLFSLPSYNQSSGHLIVVGTQTNNNGAGVQINSVSDTAGNTYVRLFSDNGFQGYNPFGNNIMQFFYAVNCLGNANNVITVNYNTTISFCMAAAYDVSGIVSSNPVDSSSKNTGTSASMTSGAYTTTQPNEFLAAFIIFASTDTINSGNQGYTVDVSVIPAGGNAASAHKTVSTTLTNETVTFTAASSQQFGVITASFIGPDGGSALTGTLGSGATSGALTVGQHRLLHISSSVSPTSSSRCAVSYTLGLSSGTMAAPPTSSSPFFLGDEGWIIDTGFYDQINLANIAAYNGVVTISYSVTILSKF